MSRAAGRAALLSAALVLALTDPAFAYWSAGGSGTGAGATGTLAAPTGVTVPANSLSSVPVAWTASGGSPAPTGYYVTRTSGGGTVAVCASSPSSLLTGTSCTDSAVPDGAYTYRVVATFRSWTASATSSAVAVWTPAKVAFTGAPTSTAAGAPITPAVAVAVQTAGGVTVPMAGRSVTVAIGSNPGGGTLSGTLSVTTDSSGLATFGNLSVNKAGAGYTLNATSSGLTSATSGGFTISAAPADRLVITSTAVSGTAAASATLGAITVQRQDPFGNPAAPAGAVAVTLTSSSTGGSFAATSGGTSTTTVTIPALASSTTFFYGDTKAGSPTITAGGSLTSATQSATIIAGTATKLAFGQQPTNTAKSATITPAVTVQIQDAFGNRTTSGASVSIAIGVNGGNVLLGVGAGNLNGTQTVNGALGLATFSTLRIDGGLLNAGGEGNGYTLVVTSTGLTAATSNPFNIT